MLYLFIVETVNLFVEFGIVYEPLIIKNGQASAIIRAPTLLPGGTPLLQSIVSAPVQLFTAWRISVITGSYIVPAFISLLSLGSFTSGILVSVMVAMNPEFRGFGNFTTEIIVWLSLSAACDIVIAVAMTHALSTRKTGFSLVDGQINRIIRLSVESGAITAMTALVDVMLFLVFPRTSLNFLVDFPLSALYTCTMLAMLNSRERPKGGDSEQALSAPQMRSPNHTLTQPTSTRRQSTDSSMTKVEIYTTTENFVAVDKSDADAASERTPDFYDYNAGGNRTPELDLSQPPTPQWQPPPKSLLQGDNNSETSVVRRNFPPNPRPVATQRSLPANPRPVGRTLPETEPIGYAR
ncbi:hypothetical protein C8R46DRAFT_1104353 [Mycena filopes]|nr:hypothetical protein C8R46DRAFT_1104353 [Mycena filopes]